MEQRHHEDDLLLVDEDDSASEQENKYLLFFLGQEEFGVSIDQVQSIEELQSIVPVPDMANYVKGVINLRGTVIPVVDLRLRFAMIEREYDDRTCIVIVNAGGRTVGFVVDTVSDVHQIPRNAIQPAPDFRGGKIHERYVSGLGMVNDEVKILLDVTQLVRADELPDNGEVRATEAKQ